MSLTCKERLYGCRCHGCAIDALRTSAKRGGTNRPNADRGREYVQCGRPRLDLVNKLTRTLVCIALGADVAAGTTIAPYLAHESLATETLTYALGRERECQVRTNEDKEEEGVQSGKDAFSDVLYCDPQWYKRLVNRLPHFIGFLPVPDLPIS